MFVVFDLETTGLSREYADVVQMAYVKFDFEGNFIESDVLYFYYPGMVIPPEASQIHGFTAENLKPYAEDFDKNLIKMFSVLNNNITVCYSKTPFDVPVAYHFLSRNGVPGLTVHFMSDNAYKFGKPMAKQVSDITSFTLMNVAHALGFTDDIIAQKQAEWFGNTASAHAHDAAFDTTATALITLKAIELGATHVNPFAGQQSNQQGAQQQGSSTDASIDDLLGDTSTTGATGTSTELLRMLSALTLRDVQSLPYLGDYCGERIVAQKDSNIFTLSSNNELVYHSGGTTYIMKTVDDCQFYSFLFS